MSKHLFTLAAAGLFTLVGGAWLNKAQACDPVTVKPKEPITVMKKVTTIEWITTTEKRREPFKKEITLHDDCGRAYLVELTGYREFEVEVRKPVPVEKWVRVTLPAAPDVTVTSTRISAR